MNDVISLTTEEAGVLGLLAGIGTLTLIIAVVIWYVLQVIARWKIYTKAGEAGWKSIIPFYNEFIMYRLTWKTLFFWVILALIFVGSIFNSVNEQFFSSENLLCGFLYLAFYVAAAVVEVMQLHKLSKSFGHGAGFTVGLVLLNPIFMLILGFGQSRYIGNTSK